MTDKTRETIISHITGNEKTVKHPYLDNKGLITAGAGFLVNAEADFVKLEFEVQENGVNRPATEAEKRAGFQALTTEKNQRKGKFNINAVAYKEATNLRLPEDKIKARLGREVEARIPKVKAEIGAETWDKLDDNRKAVLVDIHYANGSLNNYIDLKKALRKGDTAAMARESHFYSGDKADGTKHRNWERVVENHRIMGGLDQEAAKREVFDMYKGTGEEMNIPPNLRPQKPAVGEKPAAPNTEAPKPEAPKPAAAKPDQRSDQKSDAPPAADANVKSMVAELNAPDDELGEVLYKRPQLWTEGELKLVMMSKPYLNPAHPERDRVVGAVRDWYDLHYGTQPARRDETGRLIEPKLKLTPPTGTSPAMTVDGTVLGKAVSALGGDVAGLAQRTGLTKAIKALQLGLNANKSGPASLLKPDGLFGSKTKAATKQLVAGGGRARGREALALGRLGLAAEAVKRTGLAKGLGETLHHTIGELHGANSAYQPTRPSGWNAAFQDTINDVNHDMPGYTAIKPDGMIGPKSEDAFTLAAKRTDQSDFLSRFARNLGFLG